LIELFIVVGLGNPGREYQDTRHNVGFKTVDEIGERLKISISKSKHKAIIGEGTLGTKRIVLVKPQTYMNLSGESVREVTDWYKASLDNVIVVYDDIDLPLGRIRIRADGTPGTHNGMRSVVGTLNSINFPRVRMGIGRPTEPMDLADYVLSRFKDEEKAEIDKEIKTAADAVMDIIELGMQLAMGKYNGING